GLHESFDNRITRKKGDVLRPMFCTYNGIKGPPLGLHTAVSELLVQEIQRLFIVDAYLVRGFCSLNRSSQSCQTQIAQTINADIICYFLNTTSSRYQFFFLRYIDAEV